MNPLYLTKKQTTLVFLVALGVACFGLSPSMQAVIPAPDGGYPGGNTAEGQAALLSLTTGGFNTAVGFLSLRTNTTNSFNTAIGAGTLLANTADSNTATGAGALFSNTTGAGNTANGTFALFSNGTANNNTAVGSGALLNNVLASGSTAVGAGALFNATGGPYIAVGANAGTNQTTGINDLYIGDAGSAAESNVIAIGPIASSGTPYTDCFIGGIFGNPNPGVAVYIDSAGHLSTTASSRRFKDEIKPMDKCEAIFALKPVTFRYKKELDPEGTARFGLVAEDVEKVNSDLVARDREGKVYTVRYEAVNAMLLNEFLKEHRKVQEQEATIAQLKKDLQATTSHQQKQIEALTAGLQKVSAQVEMNRRAPQMVANGQ